MSMLYSRWRPDTGGYDYFASAERRGLGDDLPVPKLPAGTAIGVASTDIGRPPPIGMKHVGSGPVARGSVMPMSRAGLSGGIGSVDQPLALVLFFGAITAMVAVPAGAAGYFAASMLGKDKKKWMWYAAIGGPIAFWVQGTLEDRQMKRDADERARALPPPGSAK